MPGETVQMYAKRISRLIDAINTEYGTTYDTTGAFVQTLQGPRWIEWTDLTVNSLFLLSHSKTDIVRYFIHRQDEGGNPQIFLDEAIVGAFQLSREGVKRITQEGPIPDGILPPGTPGKKSHRSRERM